MSRTGPAFAAFAAVWVMAGCAGNGATGNPSGGSATSQAVGHDPSCADPFDGKPAAFSAKGWKTNFCLHNVPLDSIMSGGPPRDGIPPLDSPKFVSVAEANRWLRPVEPVIALAHEGQVRAYPLQILTWHEIVNDRIGSTPVAVTFCPLCYAAIVYVRPIVKGKQLSFGTTGNLRQSDMVMWDRETETWWQQFTGEAIIGELTGTNLALLPASIISWSDFKTQYPGATVLSRDTGHKRPYGVNPYAGYDDINKRPMLFRGRVDGRLAPMAHVVGVTVKPAQRAYPLQTLRSSRAINDSLGGTELVVLWKPGTASALGHRDIAKSKDIGTTGVFSRVLGDHTLTFSPRGNLFRDAETDTAWNVLGHAVSGALKGRSLTPIAHHDIFWFVWSAFAPKGELYTN